MITFRAARQVPPVVLLFLCAACSREQQDWRSAESADTREAYARFTEQHPDSELARRARTRVAELAEEADWRKADAAGTLEAYKGFLLGHPHGTWTEEARIRIEGFSLGSAPRTAPSGQAPLSAGRTGVNALQLARGSPAGVAGTEAPAAAAPPVAATVPGGPPSAEDLARPAPESRETSASAAVAPATAVRVADSDAGYGVQFGAFGSEASAGKEWARLQGRFGTQLQGLAPRIVVASTGAGTLYRLQAPANGEAQARALCATLKEQDQACVPVLPR
ncbi:MAG: SPOR domain-containing protein [Proteobacteria bacterium]|nr:SPOR domain-containing protein [Pseudomonadota bacterium]